MIYTSYFAKLKSLPKDVVAISICGKAPSWYKGLEYKKLAPTYNIFKKFKEDGDVEAFTKGYRNQVLNKLNAGEVVFELGSLANTEGNYTDRDICLLCYEKSDSFCHRHLVAEWLNNVGFECREW